MKNKYENERIEAIKRREKDRERLLSITIRKEKERIQLKEERRLEEERKKQELKRIKLHQEYLRKEQELLRQLEEAAVKENEKKRIEYFQKLQAHFHHNFLTANSFFHESCDNLISSEEYRKEKISFVKSWIGKNTTSNKSHNETLPDDEQSEAIGSVNGHIQVVARAGSGKTSTLVNRTLFLMKHCGVAPSEILILAFNRKASLEIRRRLLFFLDPSAEPALNAEVDRQINEAGRQKKINKEKIMFDSVNAVAKNLRITPPHVMTFHALAYAIVNPEENILYDGPEDEAQDLSRVVQQVIDDNLQNPLFYAQIRKLMLAHFRGDWENIVRGGYDKNKEELLRFRRSLPRQSLSGQYVKSFGEKVIADFLFEHDIEYRYEQNHRWKGINYRPDFTIYKIPKYEEECGVIIEYFGLKGDPEYDEMTEEKRKYWNDKKGWTLLEFFPQDIAEKGVDSFLLRLKQLLTEQDVSCVRLSEDEIWYRLKDRSIDRFTKAAKGFIGRCRNQLKTPSDLRSIIDQNTLFSDSEELFLNIVHQLYVSYLDRLSMTGEDDFNGLMQQAAHMIENGKTLFERKSGIGDLTQLRYICIDEFQDFSPLFYKLLISIQKQNPRIELFCVGDDWQAINGFTGADLKYYREFNKFIGAHCQHHISTNYRSSKSIVEIGNALMKGLGKPAVAHKKTFGHVRVTDINTFEPSPFEMEQHPGDVYTPAVLRLTDKAIREEHDVVLLCRKNAIPWFANGRYNQDLNLYLEFVRSFFPKDIRERITISTAHKYKGLEKSVVIILDAILRNYPLIHPTWEFFRVLGNTPERIIEEERRLLYVALTRAVEKLLIITDGRNKSPFLEELERNYKLETIKWTDYPPIIGEISSLIVKVGNQPRRGIEPTYNIRVRNGLKAGQYKYQRQKNGFSEWAKCFPLNGFSIEILKKESWARSADGVDVRIFDNTEALVARYYINSGKWSCIFLDPKRSDCINDCSCH